MPTHVWKVGFSVWIVETRGKIYKPDVHSLRVKGIWCLEWIFLSQTECHGNIEEELKLQSDLIGAKRLFAPSALIYGANCSSHGGCKCLGTDTLHIQPNPIWVPLIAHPIWSTCLDMPCTHTHACTHIHNAHKHTACACTHIHTHAHTYTHTRTQQPSKRQWSSTTNTNTSLHILSVAVSVLIRNMRYVPTI